MPLYRELLTADYNISIWKIEETESFFLQFFTPPPFSTEQRRLQWFATRHLISRAFGNTAELEKEESGKPVLKGRSESISITHSNNFAAIMWSNHARVGIDLETIQPKVLRIAPKFMEQDEIDAVPEIQKTEKLILYWSAKESLYKLHSKGGIDFKTQLILHPFELQQSGVIKADVLAEDVTWKGLDVQYTFFDGQVLTYVKL